MRNDSYTLKFYPFFDKKKTAVKYPIYVRITINRMKAEIATKLHITNLKDWDETTQRVKTIKSPLNKELGIIEGDIHNMYNKLMYTNRDVTAAELKDCYLGRDLSSPLFTDFMDSYFINKVVGNPDLAEGTKKTYKATIRHIKAFLNETKVNKITLRQIDEDFVKKFDAHLSLCPAGKNVTTLLKRNSVNKYQTKLKAMMNFALKEDLIIKNPYRNIILREEASQRTFLTKIELEALEKNSLGENTSLIKVRDIFLFSVYTGLRFNDAMFLEAKNIEFDGKKYWLLFKQQKTKEYIRIPMLKRAVEIYDKYLIERNVTGFVLPRLTNQKVNAYLKSIADLVGLTKPLTHHVARHTNATTIYLANGASLELVSKQLGHTSLRSTQVYAKITNEMLSKTVDKIDKILK